MATEGLDGVTEFELAVLRFVPFVLDLLFFLLFFFFSPS